jgi:hypothetical protein
MAVAAARLGVAVSALLLTLGGCVASDAVRRHDDGTMSIDCSGGYYDWSRCHSRAASLCGRDGFDIVSQVSDEASQGVGTRDWSAEGSVVKRTMRVRCL